MQVHRQTFYDPEDVRRSVEDPVTSAKQVREAIDNLTFVPDGEPTLYIHLGCEIERLKSVNLPIAVITNASLIWRQSDTRAAPLPSLVTSSVIC